MQQIKVCKTCTHYRKCNTLDRTRGTRCKEYEREESGNDRTTVHSAGSRRNS